MRYLPFVLLLLLFGCQPSSSENSERPPNIVIIFTDDQGWGDIVANGATGFTTPNLDRMARQGARLTSFYAAQAVCSASRAGLLTGCYPNRIGIHAAFMPHHSVGLHPDETTLAEMLQGIGYRTGIFGKWHLGDHPDFLPLQQGFDEYLGIPYSNDMWPLHPWQDTLFDFGPLPLIEGNAPIDTLTDQSELTTLLTERSVEFIARHRDEPFFLYVPHPQPHVPLYVSDKFRGKSECGLYGDVIMEIDWSVGQILSALDRFGLTDNTLVIFTSDNGPWLAYGDHAGSTGPFREGKGTAWEGGQREPCLIRWPGHIPADTVIDAPVMAIDLLPTIAAITSAPLPAATIDGQNVWPLLTGRSQEHPQEAYYFYYKTNELHAVRAGDWKLYFPHSYRSLNGRPGGTDGLPAPYEQLTVTEPELYHLGEDPGEQQNVAAAHPEVVARLSALADSMRTRLGDRLTGIEGRENREPGRREW